MSASKKEEAQKRRKAQEQAEQQRLARECAEARRERMREALATTGGVRKKASKFLDHANCFLAEAFNVGDDPEIPWGFPVETLEKVKWHFREILQLFEGGGFEVRPGSILQGDTEFQRFMQRAVIDAGAQLPGAD